MIRWFWKHRTLMHRLPVLMALLAGIMFTSMPAGKSLLHASSFALLVQSQSADFAGQQLQTEKTTADKAQAGSKALQTQKSATGEELPVYEPGFMALAQLAPLQFFFYQPVVLPVITPLVEIVEQVSAPAPDLVNQYHRILFRRIISPNAP